MVAGGIRTRAIWSGNSCASGRCARRPPSGQASRRPGRGVGGACSLSPSSAPSAARLWALRGYCPTRPWAMSRSSTGCWSWPTRKAPAGCRCARASAGRPRRCHGIRRLRASIRVFKEHSRSNTPRCIHFKKCCKVKANIGKLQPEAHVRNSWLHVPLLHAVAGTLSSDVPQTLYRPGTSTRVVARAGPDWCARSRQHRAAACRSTCRPATCTGGSRRRETRPMRRRLDLVIYGAAPLGGALCCDATLVSLLRRDGEPHPLCCTPPSGASKTPTLSSQWVGGGTQMPWGWSGALSPRAQSSAFAVQHAVGHTALGRARAVPGPAHADAPALDEVMDLAGPEGPSRLPLR